MSAAPASANLPMIVPSLGAPPEHPSWAYCSDCGDVDNPVKLRLTVEGFWDCPICRLMRHQTSLEKQERRTSVDREIAECYAEDMRRGERGGGGSRAKRYGGKKVDPVAPRFEQENSGGGRGDYVAPKMRSVKVPEDVADQVMEVAKAIKIPATRLWGVALQRGLEVLRAAPFCLSCGGALEAAKVETRECSCER